MAKQTIKIADKDTLDSVKQDTQSMSQKLDTISVEISGGIGTGIPPQKMISFKTNAMDASAKLTFEEPDDTQIDGQNICTVKGCMIRVSTDKYPETISDGTLVLDTTDLKKYKKEGYVASGLTNGVVNYFRAFPYSDHNVYNVQDCAENKAECTPQEGEWVTVSITSDDGIEPGTVTINLVNTTKSENSQEYTLEGTGSHDFYVVEGESYYITVSKSQTHITPDKSQTYTAVKKGTRGVTMQYTHFPTFSEASWSLIKKISEEGLAETAFEIGDEKNISIDGTDYAVVILDFNHDTLTAGGTAGLTIGILNSLKTTYKMNSSNTNSGGWASCELRNTLQSTILNKLPSDLRDAIKKVNKLTSAGSQSTTINTTSDNLFLLSEVEIFGNTQYSVSGEGKQYPYFVSSQQRIKKLGDNGSASGWWERSPNSSGSSAFCYVHSSGVANINSASTSYGVSFGFCI